VTRHPPCRPGRTGFPSPVPRWSAPPRGTAVSARAHPPWWDLRHAPPGSPAPVPGLGERLPGQTLPLAPAPMAPWTRTAQRALKPTGPGAGVAGPTVVGGVAAPPAVPWPGARASRQVAGRCAPGRDPTARRRELLARGTPRDPWHAVARWQPGPRASQPRAASPPARMHATDAPAVGLVEGDLAGDRRSPLGQRPRAPCGGGVVAAGADPVGGGAAPPRRAATVGLDDGLNPPGQGRGHSPVCPARGAASAWGRAGLWRPDATVGLQPPRLQPLPPQAPHGAGLAARAPPGQEPRVLPGVAAAVDIGRPPGALRAVGPIAGAVTDRLQRPPSGAIAIATLQPVLGRDGRPPRRAGPWPPLVGACGTPERPFGTVVRRPVPAPDPVGPVAVSWQARRHCRAGGLSVDGVGWRRQALAPPGGLLLQVPPAVESPVCLQAPVPLPTTGLRVGGRVGGAALQGGWRLVVRSDRGRQPCPGRAASCRQVLPPGGGVPSRSVLGLIRDPRRLPRVAPLTRRRRLPGRGATAAPRCPPGAGSGWPLPGRSSCRPSGWGVLPPGAAGASHVLGRLAAGRPRPEDAGGPAPPGHPGGAGGACGVRAPPRRPPPAPVRNCPRTAGGAGTPAAARMRGRRGAPRGHRECPHGAAMDARLATGGGRARTRPGRSPGKRRPAWLGATTLPLSGGGRTTSDV
jgi:hypothetical protein